MTLDERIARLESEVAELRGSDENLSERIEIVERQMGEVLSAAKAASAAWRIPA